MAMIPIFPYCQWFDFAVSKNLRFMRLLERGGLASSNPHHPFPSTSLLLCGFKWFVSDVQ
jgi:hypothetical protein